MSLWLLLLDKNILTIKELEIRPSSIRRAVRTILNLKRRFGVFLLPLFRASEWADFVPITNMPTSELMSFNDALKIKVVRTIVKSVHLV